MCKNLLFLFIILLSGCSYFVSWDESVQGGVGRPVENIKKIWGNPGEITSLPNGQKEYKYHLKKLDPSCVHYWIVNEEGIITGYRYTGYCRPIG